MMPITLLSLAVTPRVYHAHRMLFSMPTYFSDRAALSLDMAISFFRHIANIFHDAAAAIYRIPWPLMLLFAMPAGA